MYHQVDFRVPNTPEGQQFIKNLRLWLNRDKWSKTRARTRGPREPGPNTQATHEDATGYAIYLEESPGRLAHLAELKEWASNYMDSREYKRVSEQYEALLRAEHLIISDKNLLNVKLTEEVAQLQVWGDETKRRLTDNVRAWQYATLAASLVFSLIGYFANA